jgi:hypothetical protein
MEIAVLPETLQGFFDSLVPAITQSIFFAAFVAFFFGFSMPAALLKSNIARLKPSDTLLMASGALWMVTMRRQELSPKCRLRFGASPRMVTAQSFSHRGNYVASMAVVFGNWARIPLPRCVPSILKMPWLKSPLSLKQSFSEYGGCTNSMNLACACWFPAPVWCTARNRVASGPPSPELFCPTLVSLPPIKGLFHSICI